jgi:WD40 repeat protein
LPGIRRRREPPDYPYLIIACRSLILATRGKSSIVLIKVSGGKEAHQLPGSLEVAVTSLAFSPDGRSLVTGSTDTTALVWDSVPERSELAKRVKELGAAGLDRSWDELAGEDARSAHRAVWTLALAGDRNVALLKERLRPLAAIDPKRIPQLVADLDSKKFDDREASTRELLKPDVVS